MNFTLLKRRLLFAAAIILCASTALSQDARTQLVILGTGTPIINPDRSGPSVAVVVNGAAYLVDFGPGVVRRAAAAARDKHITTLTPKNLKVVFATHLHSDHTAGLLIFISLLPWKAVPERWNSMAHPASPPWHATFRRLM